MWNPQEIVDAVASGLRAFARADDEEHAIRSIDALPERPLQDLIQQSLEMAGYQARREEHYPSHRSHAKRSQGLRCDVVLSPVGTDAAYWLEIKTAAQFTLGEPSPQYSPRLLGPVRADVRKLAEDEGIHEAGLLLVLFTLDEPTARHDLRVWRIRSAGRGDPVDPPFVSGFPISDRVGNGHVSVALFPVCPA